MSKKVTIHEEVVVPYEIPGLLDGMRAVITAKEKLATAQGRVEDAQQALGAAERRRDDLTAAVIRGDLVGAADVSEAEKAIREAEQFALLLGRGVESAQEGLKAAERLISAAKSAEHSKRVDAASAHKQAAIEAAARAQQAVADAHKAEHEVRYIGIPANEVASHWRVLGYE